MRIAILLASLALLAAGSPPAHRSAPAIPDTPAGRRFRAWLTAFDSGSRTTFRKYLEQYNPKALKSANPGIDQQMAFYRQTGGFDLRKIVSSTPTKIDVLLQERLSDSFAEIVMQVAAKPPYTLVGGSIDPAQRPPEFALPHLTQAQLVAALQAKLRHEAAADRFSGAVLVAKNGTPIFARAYGLADRSKKIPNTVDTRFRLGSMNKMFTATAIMQLVQAGKIDLNRPFGVYLPEYPNKGASSQVTIRELLTHTGGTGDFFGPLYDKNRMKLRTLRDYIAMFGTRPLLFKPGSRFDYSNFGFIILGRIIETVSGENYYDYVREHVYGPARMSETGSQPEDVSVPRRAIGYTLAPKGGWVSAAGTLGYRGSSAGGGYSTVGDLLKFANALLAHKLLNASNTALMTTGKVAMGMGGLKYGFGFGDGVINGTRCFGHNGGAPGMNGDLEICTTDHYTVAVLSNFDPPAAGVISDFITNRLPR